MNKESYKIIIIEPPFYRLYRNTSSLYKYPNSLGYLAGAIKKATNWTVMTYNADFHPESSPLEISYMKGEGFNNYIASLENPSERIWKEIELTLASFKPDVVGISSMTQKYASARIVAGIAKKISRDCQVIIGGPHPSMVGSEVLKCPDIDIAVIGEGERTIVELLDAITRQCGFTDIDGMVYRDNGKVVENPCREFIDDLDSLSFPHINAPNTLKDYPSYSKEAFRGILATRGCPHNCSFCGSRMIWSRRPRYRSTENVISEMKSLQEKGLKLINFDDDTFGINKQYINELCNSMIKNLNGLKWSCEIHVNLVSEDLIALMKRAGCVSIDLGIESGSNEILKQIRKGFTIEKAFQASEVIKRQNIVLNTFFMTGFPQETESTLEETFNAMRQIKTDGIIYSIFTPYPNTELFKYCEDRGLIDGSLDYSLFNHQSPANYFCIDISRERFQYLSSKIESFVGMRNATLTRRRVFSSYGINKVREYGLAKSFARGVKRITNQKRFKQRLSRH